VSSSSSSRQQQASCRLTVFGCHVSRDYCFRPSVSSGRTSAVGRSRVRVYVRDGKTTRIPCDGRQNRLGNRTLHAAENDSRRPRTVARRRRYSSGCRRFGSGWVIDQISSEIALYRLLSWWRPCVKGVYLGRDRYDTADPRTRLFSRDTTFLSLLTQH